MLPALCAFALPAAAAGRISPESLAPSHTAVRQALNQRFSVITEDLNLADLNLQGAQSIVAQRLRAVVAIPLYAMPRASSQNLWSTLNPASFWCFVPRFPPPRSLFQTRSPDPRCPFRAAASILDNARLVERERQRQRLEQELNIARNIQQALIPHGFRDFPYFAVSGIHSPVTRLAATTSMFSRSATIARPF